MSGVNHSAQTLLADTAALSIPDRARALTRTARALAGTPRLAPFLDDLARHGEQGRALAIHLAVVTGCREVLLRLLDAADPRTAGRALAGLVIVGVDPATVAQRLPSCSQRARRGLARALSRADRQPIADALLAPWRRDFGDREAARLLVACSGPVVTRSLPELAYAVPSWAALWRRHPAPVLRYLQDCARGADRARWQQIWPRLVAAPQVAAAHDPDRLLALAAAALPHRRIDGLDPVLGLLARRDPDAVCRLILHPSGNGRVAGGSALWRALAALPDDRVRALFAAWPAGTRADFLRTLPPSRRAATATAELLRPGHPPGSADLTLLDLLPAADRHAAARELLARPGGADVPAVAERLTARLAWSEAEPVLGVATRRPVAEDRATAYPLLVTAAIGTRDPAVVGGLLRLLARLRNEQDPVRARALAAVSRIPMSLVRADHLPALEQLAEDGLQARDRSGATIAAVANLARALLVRGGDPTAGPEFGAAALRVLARLAELAVTPNLSGLHRDLARGGEHRLFEALAPRLTADARRDQWTLTLALAAGLEHRAHEIPGLRELLLRACTSSSDATVRAAVTAVLSDRARRDENLDRLLARDPSLLTLPAVQAIIGTRRTDLLDTLYRAAPGRFLPPDVRFVPLFATGMRRWSPYQLDRYARLLTDFARDPRPTLWERAAAVRQLGRLPGGAAAVAAFAGEAELVVSEAALTALGATGDPAAALPILAGHLGGDRARVAVGAVATCLRAVPANRVAAAAAPLLASPKVTARKEGIRLLAELRAPDAVAIIGAHVRAPDAHRDVRRAAVSATRHLFDQEPAWTLLAESAADPAVADALLDIAPAQLPEPQRPRFAAFLRELAAGPDPRVTRTALDALTRWRRWTPPGTDAVIVDRLTDFSTVALWQTAARALLAGVDAGAREGLPEAVIRLRSALSLSPPGRDLPALQRLDTVLRWFATAVRLRDEARALAPAVSTLLSEDYRLHGHVVDLAVAGLRWTEPEATVEAIEAVAPYAVGALVAAPAEQLTRHLAGELGHHPETTWAVVGAGLTARPAASSALAGLAVVDACGTRFGWSPSWVALLAALRAHPEIDVRRAAYAVFAVPE